VRLIGLKTLVWVLSAIAKWCDILLRNKTLITKKGTLPIPVVRLRYLLLLDVVIACAAFTFSLLVRYEAFQIFFELVEKHWFLIFLSALIHLFSNYIGKLYTRVWRFAGIMDAIHVFKAVSLSSGILIFTNYIIFPWVNLSNIQNFSIFFLNWVFSLVFLGGSRLALRISLNWLTTHNKKFLSQLVPKCRVLIIGAGTLGENIARWMLQNPDFGFTLVGFVDDNPAKHFSYLHGVMVLGGRKDLPRLVNDYNVNEVIIAMSKASSSVLDDTFSICADLDVQIRIIPGLADMLGGTLSIAQLRQWRPLNKSVHTHTRPIEKPDTFHNILVAGGAGFIGANFARYMLAKYPDYRIVVYDKLTYAGNLDNLQGLDKKYADKYFFVKGDICNGEQVNETIQQYEIDAIVNFAAETHVDRSLFNPDVFVQNNVFGTHKLLEAAKLFGNIRYHQVSTDEVYGEVLRGSFHEDDPLETRSPYSASKGAADLLASSYYFSFGLPVTITRGSNNIGPYQYPEKVVPLFITNALENQPLPIYGDGKYARDYQHVMDHCSGIDLVLHCGQLGEIYNVGGGNEVEALKLAKLILKKLNKPYSLIRFVEDRIGQDRRYSLNCAKIKNLGWVPQYTFETAIDDTIHWYINNEWWWRKIKSGEYLEYYEKQYRERLDKAIETVFSPSQGDEL